MQYLEVHGLHRSTPVKEINIFIPNFPVFRVSDKVKNLVKEKLSDAKADIEPVTTEDLKKAEKIETKSLKALINSYHLRRREGAQINQKQKISASLNEKNIGYSSFSSTISLEEEPKNYQKRESRKEPKREPRKEIKKEPKQEKKEKTQQKKGEKDYASKIKKIFGNTSENKVVSKEIIIKLLAFFKKELNKKQDKKVNKKEKVEEISQEEKQKFSEFIRSKRDKLVKIPKEKMEKIIDEYFKYPPGLNISQNGRRNLDFRYFDYNRMRSFEDDIDLLIFEYEGKEQSKPQKQEEVNVVVNPAPFLNEVEANDLSESEEEDDELDSDDDEIQRRIMQQNANRKEENDQPSSPESSLG